MEIILKVIIFTYLAIVLTCIYFVFRAHKLKKTVELLRIDRNELMEERAKQSNKLRLKGIEMDKTNKEEFILSELDRKMILNALKMPEYKKAIEDPETKYQVKKAYMMLKEKIKESLRG